MALGCGKRLGLGLGFATLTMESSVTYCLELCDAIAFDNIFYVLQTEHT